MKRLRALAARVRRKPPKAARAAAPRTRATKITIWAIVALYAAVTLEACPYLYGIVMAGLLVTSWLAWADGALPWPKPRVRGTPDPTVLYRLYAADGALLYVGISRDMERRMRHHSLSKGWWPEVTQTETRTYRTRLDAARAEHTAITRESPRHNVLRLGLEAHLRSARAR